MANALEQKLEGRGDVHSFYGKPTIRAAALHSFTKQLDARLAELTDETALAISFQITIVGKDGKALPRRRAVSRSVPEYSIWKKAVFARDGGCCQDCGALEHLNAHHIKPWSRFPDLRFDLSNGMTLCDECHIARHPKVPVMRRGKKN